MQKVKIKAVHEKTPTTEMCLEYYLVLKGGLCGIEVRDTRSKESAVRMIPDMAEKTYQLLVKLARHTITPIALDDVVDNYISERWRSKRGLYLLHTGADAGLDCGQRNAEPVGDLLAGVSANEG